MFDVSPNFLKMHPFNGAPRHSEEIFQMSDVDEGEESAKRAAAKVASELALTTLTPAAEEIGKSLVSVAKLVNVALTPVEGVVWGYDRIRDYVVSSLTKKLRDEPVEEIQTPPAHVAVPLIESMRYAGNIPELREMFLNLLTASMLKGTSEIAHPAFVEIIRQLSTDEARVLSNISSTKYYPVVADVEYGDNDIHSQYEKIYPIFRAICERAGVSNVDQYKTYLDNLQRLNIFELRHSGHEEITEKGMGHAFREYDISPAYELNQSRYEAVYVTSFGQQFILACTDNDHDTS